MSLERQGALIDRIVESQPALGSFVRDQATDMTAGSWDLVSYSFQRGFEAMWNLAVADHSGLLVRPLLSLWRQSVELAIKASVLELASRIEGRPGHDLKALFALLLKARAELGCVDDDVLAAQVQAMIALVQSFDPFAGRFRYPAERGGTPYVGIDVDLDELFQAHWIIVTWCEGAVIEVKGWD